MQKIQCVVERITYRLHFWQDMILEINQRYIYSIGRGIMMKFKNYQKGQIMICGFI